MTKPFRVLVTRPEHQSERLSLALKSVGADVLSFPTLKISPVKDIKNVEKHGNNIEAYHILIFISANAVFHSLPLWDVSRIHGVVIAMGSATKRALEDAGLQHSVLPDEPFTTESLLKMPELSDIRGKKILLVTGEGGRALLEDELNQRGALVSRVEVYVRECPATDPVLLDVFWSDNLPRIIVSTSFESLQNLLALTPLRLQIQLKHTPLLVVSSRLEGLARSLSLFDQILVAKNASDEAILAKIQAWYDALI